LTLLRTFLKIPAMDKVLCIGAAHIDRKATAQSDVLLGMSIPVSVGAALGGVHRGGAQKFVVTPPPSMHPAAAPTTTLPPSLTG
jgi:hypothetical protein